MKQQNALPHVNYNLNPTVPRLARRTSIRRYRIPELDVSSVKHTYTNAVKQCDLPTLFGGQSVANFCKHIANNYDIRLALAGLPQNYGRSEDLIANPSLVFTWATDNHHTTDVYTFIASYMDKHDPQDTSIYFKWNKVFLSLERWMGYYREYCRQRDSGVVRAEVAEEEDVVWSVKEFTDIKLKPDMATKLAGWLNAQDMDRDCADLVTTENLVDCGIVLVGHQARVKKYLLAQASL